MDERKQAIQLKNTIEQLTTQAKEQQVLFEQLSEELEEYKALLNHPEF